MKTSIAVWTTAVILTTASLPVAVQAEVLLSGHVAGQCLDMKNGAEAIVWSCHGAGNQDFRFRTGAYGELLVGGKCLASSGKPGSGLVATNCNGTRAQKLGRDEHRSLA